VYSSFHNIEKPNMTSTSTDHHQYKNNKNNYVTKTLITDQFLNYNNGTNVLDIDVIVIES